MASFGMGNSSNPAPAAAAATAIDASTPFLAASEGNLDLLKQSLQSLNQPATIADENGYTLLMAAASYNHIPILQWIVGQVPKDQQSAYLHATDREGDNVQHYVGNAETSLWLMKFAFSRTSEERSAKYHHMQLLYHQNNSGKTPLQVKQEELHELLKDEDIEEEDDDVMALKATIEYQARIVKAHQDLHAE